MHSKSSAIRQDCRAFFAHQSFKTAGPCPWRQKALPPSLRPLPRKTARGISLRETGPPAVPPRCGVPCSHPANFICRGPAHKRRTGQFAQRPHWGLCRLRRPQNCAAPLERQFLMQSKENSRRLPAAMSACRRSPAFRKRNRRTLCGCLGVRWRSHEQSSGLFEHTVLFCRFAAKCGPCFWPVSTLDDAMRENCPSRDDAFLRQHA